MTDPLAWAKTHKGATAGIAGAAAAGGLALYRHSSGNAGPASQGGAGTVTGAPMGVANTTGTDAYNALQTMNENLAASVRGLQTSDRAQRTALRSLGREERQQAAVQTRLEKLIARLQRQLARGAGGGGKKTKGKHPKKRHAPGRSSALAASQRVAPATTPTGTKNRPTAITAPRQPDSRPQPVVAHAPVFHAAAGAVAPTATPPRRRRR